MNFPGVQRRETERELTKFAQRTGYDALLAARWACVLALLSFMVSAVALAVAWAR